jgi:hypothetical protein
MVYPIQLCVEPTLVGCPLDLCIYVHAKTSLYYQKSYANASIFVRCNYDFTFTIYGSP